MFKKKNIFYIFLFLISFVYLFIRFYHFENLIEFRLDQGLHLLETKTMVDNRKIQLIGPMVTSKSLDGRNFFIGANYYYVLVIVGYFCGWQPLPITAVFVVIEFIFYLFFISWLQKKFGKEISLLTFLFIAVSPYLVIHSRFFWNPHLLIPLSILSIYFFDRFLTTNRNINIFISGFFWGFAFACHYTAAFWIIPFVVFFIRQRKIFKLKYLILLVAGFVLGDLPFIVFEFRHSFYNTKTMFYIFTNTTQAGDLTSHYFVFSLMIFILFAFLWFMKSKKYKFYVITSLYFVLTIIQLIVFKNYRPLDAIPGWDFKTQNRVADMIAKNCPKNFNVAATMQGDTRFYDLRYLLNIRKCNPEGVEDYPKSKILYFLAPTDRLPDKESVWEVTSMKPFKVDQKVIINDYLVFYEISRE